MTGSNATGGDLRADVAATAREMWQTRPARDGEGRVVAGVAAAVARRYAIDPLLVRVGFVVATFTGVGVLLYLAGWLVLPRAADATVRRRTHPLLVVALAVATLIAVGQVTGGAPGAIVGLLVVAALLYALHRHRSELGRPHPRVAVGSDGPDATGGPAGTGDVSAVPAAGVADPTPPRWDPLGAAPFAWDLPEPDDEPPPPRSRVVPLTLAAALLGAGAVLVLGLLGVLPLGVTPVAGTALAVVGLGLVVGSFRERGRPLVLAAVPLVLVLLAASGSSWVEGDQWDGAPQTVTAFADGSWAPRTAAEVAPTYTSGAGTLLLDLRALPPGPPVSTTLESGAGDITVLVGPTATVTSDCATGAGQVQCLDTVGQGGADGPMISVEARTGLGNVEVRRG